MADGGTLQAESPHNFQTQDDSSCHHGRDPVYQASIQGSRFTFRPVSLWWMTGTHGISPPWLLARVMDGLSLAHGTEGEDLQMDRAQTPRGPGPWGNSWCGTAGREA